MNTTNSSYESPRMIRDERDRLRARVMALEAALRPFADWAIMDTWEQSPFADLIHTWEGIIRAKHVRLAFTLTDIRRAAKLLAAPSEAQGG